MVEFFMLWANFTAKINQRVVTARSPALLASPSPRFASPACFAPAGIAARGQGQLDAAGSLTPSGVRLKAPASPGLFRGTRIGKIEKF